MGFNDAGYVYLLLYLCIYKYHICCTLPCRKSSRPVFWSEFLHSQCATWEPVSGEAGRKPGSTRMSVSLWDPLRNYENLPPPKKKYKSLRLKKRNILFLFIDYLLTYLIKRYTPKPKKTYLNQQVPSKNRGQNPPPGIPNTIPWGGPENSWSFFTGEGTVSKDSVLKLSGFRGDHIFQLNLPQPRALPPKPQPVPWKTWCHPKGRLANPKVVKGSSGAYPVGRVM